MKGGEKTISRPRAPEVTAKWAAWESNARENIANLERDWMNPTQYTAF